MNATIDIRLSPALQALVTRGAAAIVMPAIAAAMDEQNELTVGVATAKRMSFPRTQKPTPEGLRVITNTLRRSVRRSDAEISGSKILSAIGSNVRYFSAHEFGFNGSVTVAAHTRQNPARLRAAGTQGSLSLSAAARAGLLTKSGAPRKGAAEVLPQSVASVREFVRKVNLPARRMVQRTVEERIPNYIAAIETHVRAALEAGTA